MVNYSKDTYAFKKSASIKSTAAPAQKVYKGKTNCDCLDLECYMPLGAWVGPWAVIYRAFIVFIALLLRQQEGGEIV
jgi:hypothetical protein